jgi:hypothetical protein
MDAESLKKCPKCGGEVSFGYGFAGGGDKDGNPAGYYMCLDDCNWVGPTCEPAKAAPCFPFGRAPERAE